MKATKIVAIIGLVILIVGTILAFVGPSFLVTRDWKRTFYVAYKDAVVSVSEFQEGNYPTYVPPIISGETRDYSVIGIVEVTKGDSANFYVFNETNYRLWKEDKPYSAYVETTVGRYGYSFLFHPTKQDTEKLYFIIQKTEPGSVSVKIYATMDWWQYVYTSPAPREWLTMGAGIGASGIVIIVIAVFVSTYRERIMTKLLGTGATSPETAITLDEAGLNRRERLNLFVTHGIVKKIDGRYYVVLKPELEKIEVGLPQSSRELYERLEKRYVGAYGAGTGTWILKRKIQSCLKQGLKPEEAIRKVAQDEGYL